MSKLRIDDRYVERWKYKTFSIKSNIEQEKIILN